jgi:hypothetical protein
VAEAETKVAAAPDVAGERLDRRGRRAVEPARELGEAGGVERNQ